MQRVDVIVIGGGAAGLSAGYFLAQKASIVVLERESAISYHSSGRTAAQFTTGIAADTMRKLGHASRAFFENPPQGFVDGPLLSPRGTLTVGPIEHKNKLERLYKRLEETNSDVRCLNAQECIELFPALKPDNIAFGVFEADSKDIDVDRLLQGFAKWIKKSGSKIETNAEVLKIERQNDQWIVTTKNRTYCAPSILNAAGAWVDEIAKLAGEEEINIQPCRRTAFTFEMPEAAKGQIWPHVGTTNYDWYVQPEHGCFMGSLADAEESEPCDAYPEDIDLAQAIFNIESETTLEIGRPIASWAGLRNFVKDKNPVAGCREGSPHFYWSAAQGGCGIITSPALGAIVATMILGEPLPAIALEIGIRKEDLSPSRASLKDN